MLYITTNSVIAFDQIFEISVFIASRIASTSRTPLVPEKQLAEGKSTTQAGQIQNIVQPTVLSKENDQQQQKISHATDRSPKPTVTVQQPAITAVTSVVFSELNLDFSLSNRENRLLKLLHRVGQVGFPFFFFFHKHRDKL